MSALHMTSFSRHSRCVLRIPATLPACVISTRRPVALRRIKWRIAASLGQHVTKRRRCQQQAAPIEDARSPQFAVFNSEHYVPVGLFLLRLSGSRISVWPSPRDLRWLWPPISDRAVTAENFSRPPAGMQSCSHAAQVPQEKLFRGGHRSV